MQAVPSQRHTQVALWSEDKWHLHHALLFGYPAIFGSWILGQPSALRTVSPHSPEEENQLSVLHATESHIRRQRKELVQVQTHRLRGQALAEPRLPQAPRGPTPQGLHVT